MMRKAFFFLMSLFFYSLAYSQSKQVFNLEAENGLISSPMQVSFDEKASGDLCVFSSSSNIGKADFFFSVKSSSTFVLWARSLSVGRGSFFVSVDGGIEEVFYSIQSPNWQWNRFTKTFILNPGVHAIHFRSRDEGTKLDKIVITSELNTSSTNLAGIALYHPCPTIPTGSNACIENIIQYQIKPIYESNSLSDIEKCFQIEDIMIRKLNPLTAENDANFFRKLHLYCSTCSIRMSNSGCPWAVVKSTP